MVQKRTTERRTAAPPDPTVWDDLRYALFVARDGSVRRAARALGVSHSTVLRRIAHLEAQMRVRLFERKLGVYEPTPAGQDVFETAAAVEDVVGALERRVEGRDQRLEGPVRITLPDPLLPPLLPIVGAIARAHPAIEMTLGLSTGFADLAHREADIAIRIAAEPPPELVGRKVGLVAVGVYGSRAYLAGRTTKDLGALDWVRFEAGSSMVFERWAVEHAPRARTAVRVTSAWGIREAIHAGLGVGVVPCMTGDTELAWQRLRVVPDLAAPLWILTHKDLRATARVRVLRDMLYDALVARRDVLEGRLDERHAPERRTPAPHTPAPDTAGEVSRPRARRAATSRRRRR